jgi:hypothetical protein
VLILHSYLPIWELSHVHLQYNNKVSAKKTAPDFYFKTAGIKLAQLNTPCWISSNLQTWTTPFVKASAKKTSLEKTANRLDLRNFVRENGPYVASRNLAGWMRKEANVGEQVLKFYNITDLLVRDFSMAALTKSAQFEKSASSMPVVGSGVGALAGGLGGAVRGFIPGAAVGGLANAIAGDRKKSLTERTLQGIAVGGLGGSAVLGAAGALGGGVGGYRLGETYDELRKAEELQQLAKHASQGSIKYDKAEMATELPWRKKLDLPDVKVITSGDLYDDTIKHTISSSEREKIMKGEIIIKDNRPKDAKSHVYASEVGQTLTNPDRTGIYKMITRSGQFKDVLIVVAPKTIGSGSSTHVVAIALDGKGCRLGGSDTFYVQPNLNTIGQWWSKLEDMKDVKNLKVGGHYVILTPGRKGTLPFCVVKKKDSLDGGTEYYVMDSQHDSQMASVSKYSKYSLGGAGAIEPKTEYADGRNYVHCFKGYKNGKSSDNYENWEKGRHIVVTNKMGDLQNVGGTLFAPKNCKVVALSEPEGDQRLPDVCVPRARHTS